MCDGCAQGSFPNKGAIIQLEGFAEKGRRMYDVPVLFDSPQSDIND